MWHLPYITKDSLFWRRSGYSRGSPTYNSPVLLDILLHKYADTIIMDPTKTKKHKFHFILFCTVRFIFIWPSSRPLNKISKSGLSNEKSSNHGLTIHPLKSRPALDLHKVEKGPSTNYVTPKWAILTPPPPHVTLSIKSLINLTREKQYDTTWPDPPSPAAAVHNL